MDSKKSDLKQSLPFSFPWSDVFWKYNTGRDYQHKQDLVAVFHNTFSYINQKVEAIYEDTGTVDFDTLNDLIYEFRNHFSLSGRIEGINYYDDLILMLIDRYKAKLVLSFDNGAITTKTGEKPEGIIPILFIAPESRQALYDALKPLVDDTSIPALFALIVDGKVPDNKIVVTCSLSRFGLLFYNVKAVPEKGADLLSKQLPNYFLRNDGKEISTLKSSNLVKELLGGIRGRDERRKKRDNP